MTEDEQRVGEDSGVTAMAVDTEDCDHPADAVSRLATNGLTAYYRCERCGGVVVAQAAGR